MNDDEINSQKTTPSPTTTRSKQTPSTSIWNRIDRNSTIQTQLQLIFKEAGEKKKRQSKKLPCSKPVKAMFVGIEQLK